MSDSLPNEVLIIGIGTVIFLVLAAFIVFMTLTYQKRQLLHQQEVTGLMEAYQKEILNAQLEMQEQTFLSISQEIHDNVGQVLSLIKLQVSSFEKARPENLKSKVGTTKGLIDQAIQDLRSLSKRLNSKYVIEQDLTVLLRNQLNLIQKTGFISTVFEVSGKEELLDAEKKLIIFRIVQEAINNCLKHAGASTLKIELLFSPSHLVLSVQDDGKGFQNFSAASDLQSAKGTGISNMKYRAELIGAVLTIESISNSGTRVSVKLPFLN